MRIDPTIAASLYKTNREQYSRYLATVARLEAQLKGEDYQVPEKIKNEYPIVAIDEMKHFLDRKLQLETQLGIAEQIVVQKKQDIAQEKAKIEQAEAQLKLAEEELKMVSPLAVEQLISKREMLRLQRDVANLKGEVASGKATLPKAQAAFEQAQFELQQVPTRFKNEDEEQLKDIMIKLVEEQGSTLESKDRLTRTEIRSPIKGIVKEIKLKTVGGVIRGADEILTIVPYEDTLLVEANVLPSDVAFTHAGQEATVKIMAYDYSIYGSLKGQLIEISADTVHDAEQRKDFYRVLLRTDKNYLEHNGKKLPIIPGMTVEVDILTGTRSVMQYLLKPLIKGTKSSLTER
jgi:adhesin transport system membrane fusion protein